MNESSGRNKNFFITAAGVVIFLAAGIFTMLFFPDSQVRQASSTKQQAQQKLSLDVAPIEAIKIKPRQEIKIEIPKTKSDWYVYVTGEVKKPGYYKISADSRIFQAIEAAGGFTDKADITSVNMASRLIDGFQINVLAKGAKKIPVTIPGMQVRPTETILINQQATVQTQTHTHTQTRITSSRTITQSYNDGQVNINSATVKDLEKLSGVGPALAKRIIDYRNKNGNFSSPEDLLKVRGIGKAKLEKMRSQILIH